MLGELWIVTLLLVGIVAVWSGAALLTLTVLLAGLVSVSLLIWRRYCLAGVSYRRELGATRAAFGETVALTLELINLKLLPLTWLRIEDTVPRGLAIAGATVVGQGRADRTQALTLLTAMLPYERVVRRMEIRCNRRGELAFGPAVLELGDYLGTLTRRAAQPETDRLIVYPKLFPVHLGPLPSDRLLGRDRAHRSALADPVRAIGAREYRPGDPYRSIDWRSSARSDTLMVRVAEPSTNAAAADHRQLGHDRPRHLGTGRAGIHHQHRRLAGPPRGGAALAGRAVLQRRQRCGPDRHPAVRLAHPVADDPGDAGAGRYQADRQPGRVAGAPNAAGAGRHDAVAGHHPVGRR